MASHMIKSQGMFGSISGAITAIFNTIGNVAHNTTQIVDGVGTAAIMFNRTMDNMDRRHKVRTDIEQSMWEDDIINSFAEQIADEHNRIQDKMQNDKNFKNLFEEQVKILKAIVHPAKP